MSKLLRATDIKRLEDGVHKGAVVGVEDRTTPQGYEYVDVWFESKEAKIKTSYPANVNSKSGLGKLLQRFGLEIKPGQDYDVEKLLVGQKVQFQTYDDGDFVNVVRGTEKLLED